MSGIAVQEVSGVGALIMLPANELDNVPVCHSHWHFGQPIEEGEDEEEEGERRGMEGGRGTGWWEEERERWEG